MTCKRMAPLLSRYHDGVLDARHREEVRAHLRTCAACAERLAAYGRIQASVADAMSLAPSTAFRSAVLAATTGRRALSPRSSGSRHSRFGQLFFGSLTGASIATLAILVFALSAHMGASHHTNLAGKVPVRTMVLHHAVSTPTAMPRVRGNKTPPVTSTAARTAMPTTPVAPERTNTPERVYQTTSLVPDKASLLRVSREAIIAAGAVHYPLWSPNGSTLLYLTDFGTHCRDDWYCGTLHVRGPRGTLTLATHVRSFAFSPDGTMIAYTSERTGAKAPAEPQDLHIVRIDGSRDRVLTQIDRTSIEWLQLGIIAAQHGRVVAVAPARGTVTPLSRITSVAIGDDSMGFMAVSANARFLAYQDASGLRIWDRDRGGVPVVHQPSSRLSESSFHFSWDGNTVFFSTYSHAGSGKGFSKLFRQRLAPLSPPAALDSGRTRAEQINLVGPPSSDSTIASFRTGTGATTRSYVVGAASGSAHLLLSPDGDGPVGWWSPDGLRMIYVVYRGSNAQFSAIARVSTGS